MNKIKYTFTENDRWFDMEEFVDSYQITDGFGFFQSCIGLQIDLIPNSNFKDIITFARVNYANFSDRYCVTYSTIKNKDSFFYLNDIKKFKIKPFQQEVFFSKDCYNKFIANPYIPTTNFNKIAKFCYQEAKDKGWHESSEKPDLSKYLMNMHGEISELWEAFRKNKLNELCDKSDKMEEPLSCFEEEIADILIRTFDLAAAFNLDLDKCFRSKIQYNRKREHRHGGKLC